MSVILDVNLNECLVGACENFTQMLRENPRVWTQTLRAWMAVELTGCGHLGQKFGRRRFEKNLVHTADVLLQTSTCRLRFLFASSHYFSRIFSVIKVFPL